MLKSGNEVQLGKYYSCMWTLGQCEVLFFKSNIRVTTFTYCLLRYVNWPAQQTGRKCNSLLKTACCMQLQDLKFTYKLELMSNHLIKTRYISYLTKQFWLAQSENSWTDVRQQRDAGSILAASVGESRLGNFGSFIFFHAPWGAQRIKPGHGHKADLIWSQSSQELSICDTQSFWSLD